MHLRLPCPFPPPLFSPSSRPSREQRRESACRPLAPTSRPWSLAACLSAGGGWARAFPGPVENRLTPFDSPVCRLHPFKVLVFLSLRTSAFRQVWRLHLGSCTCGRPLGDLGGNDLCRLPAGGRSACLRGHPASQGFRPLLGTLAFQVEGSPVLGKRRAFRDWKMQPFGESYCQCLPLTSGIRKKKGHPSHEGPLGGRGGPEWQQQERPGGGVVGARGPGGRSAQRAAGGPPAPLGQILLHCVPTLRLPLGVRKGLAGHRALCRVRLHFLKIYLTTHPTVCTTCQTLF